MPEPNPHAHDWLLPYLPRIARDWASDPDRRHRILEASLVFADLTGFTGMTERLASTGRRGAEEMSTIIAETFDAMLGAAYEAGGSLLKFGGDALLLIFDQPQHERAAAWAAWNMRTTLRRRSNLATSVGRVRLGMSTAIASGPVHLLLGGTYQRELIVAGETVATLLALERSAATGATLMSDATASRLPASVTSKQEVGSARLIRRPPSPLRTQPGAYPAVGDLSPMVPLAVRRRFADGDLSPRHRRIAIGFVGVAGLDRILQSSPSDAGDALDNLVRTVETAAQRHGAWLLASDVAADGAKLIVITGAPDATGHDEASLLLTLSEVVRTDTPLEVRIGAHHGPVFFGDIGPTYRRTLTVMGDTVNTAARLMGAAAPGTVLAARSMLESRHVQFDSRPPRSIQLRGRRAPLEVVEVEGPATDQARVSTGGLVGREDEMARLDQVRDNARNGSGAVVEIVGPPGSGRSRLIAEFLARSSDIASISVEASLHEKDVPYAVIRRVFEQATGISTARPDAGARLRRLTQRRSPELLPELALVARPLGLGDVDDSALSSIDPRYLPAMTRRAVAAVLSAWAPPPFLIVIDDVHLTDPASLDVIRYVAGLSSDRAWVLCATAAEAASIDWGTAQVESIELGPLDQQTLVSLATELTEDNPLSTRDLNELVGRSGGNPLLLREMISARAANHDISEIPTAVESITALHIDALPARRRRQLEVASVLGAVFDPDLYAWVSEDDWADLVAEDGIVQPTTEGRLRFANPLTRDVVYDRLPFSYRTQLHHRVASRLKEISAPADQQAFHMFRAELWQDARDAALSAAEDAQRNFANAAALHWLLTALTSTRHLQTPNEETSRLLARIGDTRDRIGEYAAAAEAYREAERTTEDTGHKARLLIKRGRMQERLGNYPNALRCLTRARNLAPSAPEVVTAATAYYAGIRFNQGRHPDARTLAQQAAGMAEHPASRPYRALALMILDMARSALGEELDGEASRESLRLYHELGDLGGQARVTNNLGMFAFFQGDWNEASRLYDQSRDIFIRIGDEANASYGAANLAEIWAAQGRYDQAIELLEDVRRVWRAADDRYGAAYIEAQLGLIAASRGSIEESEKRLHRAIEQFDAIGAKAETEETAWHMVEAALIAGQPGQARRVMATFGLGEVAESGRNPSRIARLQAVADWQERGPMAEPTIEAALELARRSGDEFDELRLLELSARAGLTSFDDPRRHELTDRLGTVLSPVFPAVTAGSRKRTRGGRREPPTT